MEIGIAKERAASSKEVRIILLPPEVKKIVQAGHKVFVEKNAAIGIYINDNEYKAAGAAIVNQPQKIFNKQLVVKIKPPRTREFRLMKGNILFSMIHAEQNPHYVRQIRERNVKAVAMEEVKDSYGERLIECTAMTGSQGMLMAFHHSPKIPSECRVLILGYGHVATGAIRAANQLEAKVRIMRRHEYSNIEHFLKGKDIIVNAIRWPKPLRERGNYLITRKMLKLLNPGAIILDLSVDYPNPIETCHPTFLNNPFYFRDGVKHISIYGYPGLTPVSSSSRYSRQACPLILKIANKGLPNCPQYIKRAIIA